MIALVLGHGYLIDPASRNAAWREGHGTPAQYTDNELNCGGFNTQWSTNNGKCGVCGDRYDDESPNYVHPGNWATGTITKTVGDIGTAPITQAKLQHVLQQPNGDTKWYINTQGDDLFTIELMLPTGLTCDHCVLQWWWNVGNNWGCDGPGDCGMGKGPQETFVNCADIKIVSSK
ncbi:hypothetical protein OS493_012741 [Desmophyllum pertusum]|uniref:Chitin-binding type-4 domain-containing protein n=1 Tax=Desmophyllum pertusum TaxID=174260 RepID=A0A9X0D063_9CNID|nr:hypothetical protein OS493_012741 [Desmophyllum pertusum]